MKGWVYVFRNPGVPGLVKIGHTTNDPEQRAKELDHTGVPHPFLVDYQALIEEPRNVEQQVHQALSTMRVRKEREWFRCTTEEAIVAIKQVAGPSIIDEIYKAADRAKAEALHKREIADRETEQQLRNEDAEIRRRFKQQLEASFTPWPFWRYWVVCSFLCLIVFAFLPKITDANLLLLSVIGGATVPLFLRGYIEEKRKHSRAYTSIEKQRDTQLAEIGKKRRQIQPSVMKEINLVHEVLSGPVPRAEYDRRPLQQTTPPSALPTPALKSERHPDEATAKRQAQKNASGEVRAHSTASRFITYSNGTVLDTRTNLCRYMLSSFSSRTVLDTQTNLMWAARDNGSDINWANAESYCENYRGGGYTDWRMPTQDELASLYDRGKTQPGCDSRNNIHMATELIRITGYGYWSQETRGSEAALFSFLSGKRGWPPQSMTHIDRALPVRLGK